MYKTTVCVDLRSFDREDPSYGVEDYFQKLGFVPDTICFLNFQVMFLFGFKEITDEYLDPICVGQNGTPCSQRWTCRDLYGLIRCIRPVSYTHLDVYKRQPLNSLEELDTIYRRLLEIHQSATEGKQSRGEKTNGRA